VFQGRGGQFQDGSGLGTGMQVPTVPASAHELHGPAHAVAQQTFCAQWPLAQTLSSMHDGSFGSRHWRFRQTRGKTHAESLMQPISQRVPLALHL
jgi:hypothetical protein